MTETLAAKRPAVGPAIATRKDDAQFRLMVEGIKDYAILMLDPDGIVTTWNKGAERIKGYRAEEIVGRHFSAFYLPEDVAAGKPQRELEKAVADGRFEDAGWRLRKDATKFWAEVIITPIYNRGGKLAGFGKVTRDATDQMRYENEQKRYEHILEEKNGELLAAVKELDAFTYSVSHDLRAPLRAVDAFTQILLNEHGADLAPEPREYLQLVRDNTVQMGNLIDDLLAFARLGRQPLTKQAVTLGPIVGQVLTQQRALSGERAVDVKVADLPPVSGDPALLKQVLVNLIGNAFKYTKRRADAAIEIGSDDVDGERVFFVRDNGAGFNMEYAGQLFKVFQRLHRVEEFEGTGVGLAIVQRIINRHGGRVWADATVGEGATFYFTLGAHVHG
ncbi:MAG: ATP-binding protein [Pseudolabrys sp.]